MANFNIDKIFSELSKLDADEMYEAYKLIKDFVQKALTAKQLELDEKSSELASKIEKL